MSAPVWPDEGSAQIVLPSDIGFDEACERLDRVRSHVLAAGADLVALYRGRAWLAFGLASWEALCDRDLGGVRIALPRDERREAIAELREAGLSTRAIGAALGVSKDTVHRDLAGVSNETPAPVTGADGKTYPAHVTTTTRTTEATKVEHDVDLDTGEIIDGGLAEQAGRAAAEALDLEAILPPEGPEERAARLRLNFAKAVAAAGRLGDFDAANVAAVIDDDEARILADTVRTVSKFGEAVAAHRRPGLRLIGDAR